MALSQPDASNQSRSQSLPALAVQWARDSVRARGVWQSCRYLAEQAWEVFRDSLPERRRSRFGDIDFDCEHGVDTTWARLPWSVRLREVFTERLYQATFPDEFGVMMQHLARVDFTEFTFIDMGSGKGRVLLMAAQYPFRQVVGVEVQRELHEVAEANFARVADNGLACRDLVAVCADARDYVFPSTPLLVYLFNPFPDYVMKTVIANLERSLKEQPRHAYVIYSAPFDRHLFERTQFIPLATEDPRFVVYSNRLE